VYIELERMRKEVGGDAIILLEGLGKIAEHLSAYGVTCQCGRTPCLKLLYSNSLFNKYVANSCRIRVIW
jgi:hypothetical protein